MTERDVIDDGPRFIEALSLGRYKRLHLFGDSHFALHHPVVGVEPRHLGPRTMHRVGRDGVALFNLNSYRYEETDALGFVFGEIDVRVHLAKQQEQGRTPNNIISDLVQRYGEAICGVLKESGRDHAVVFSVVPPAGYDYPNFDESLPRHGSDSDRAGWAIDMNNQLAFLATKHNFGYVDQYTSFADSSGLLCRDVTVDGVHVQQKYFRQVDWNRAFI